MLVAEQRADQRQVAEDRRLHGALAVGGCDYRLRQHRHVACLFLRMQGGREAQPAIAVEAAELAHVKARERELVVVADSRADLAEYSRNALVGAYSQRLNRVVVRL